MALLGPPENCPWGLELLFQQPEHEEMQDSSFPVPLMLYLPDLKSQHAPDRGHDLELTQASENLSPQWDVNLPWQRVEGQCVKR